MVKKKPCLCPTCGAELPEGVRWRNGMIVGKDAAVPTGFRYTDNDAVTNARIAISALDADQREMLRVALEHDGKRRGHGIKKYKG